MSNSKKNVSVKTLSKMFTVGPRSPFMSSQAMEKYAKVANLDLLEEVRSVLRGITGCSKAEAAVLAHEVDMSSMPKAAATSLGGRGHEACGTVTRPLFMRGHDAYVASTVMEKGSSKVATIMNNSWLSKVGQQGGSFSTVHQFNTSTWQYIRPRDVDGHLSGDWLHDILHDMMDETEVNIIDRRNLNLLVEATEWLVKYIGDLEPLTMEEAIEVIAKDTSAWPLGCHKLDAAAREYVAANWDNYDIRPSALLGQRYQRNKHYEDGTPRLRDTFNADILSVARAARWIQPLTVRLQELARRTQNSAFAELNGHSQLGHDLAAYVNRGGKLHDFSGIALDVKGMDKAMDFHHCSYLVEKILKPCYRNKVDEYDLCSIGADLLGTFKGDLYLPGGVVIHAGTVLEFALFSGIFPTHDFESLWSYLVMRVAVSTVCFRLQSEHGLSTPKTLASDNGVLIWVGGDDAAVITSLPRSYVNAARVRCYDIDNPTTLYEGGLLEHFARVYHYFGFECHPAKCMISEGMVEFCSHYYYPRAAITETEGGSADSTKITCFRAVYAPTAALNAICNPEEGLADTSLTAEVQRVAMIADSVDGHEKCSQLFDMLCRSLSDEDVAALRDLFSLGLDAISWKKELFQSWRTFDNYWSPKTSVFIAYLIRHLDALASGKELTSIEKRAMRDRRLMRVLFWRYRMDPDMIEDINLYKDADSAYGSLSQRFEIFFDDDATEADVDVFMSHALSHDVFGRVQVERDPADYDHSKGFHYNFEVDKPLTVSARLTKEAKQGQAETKSLKDGFDW